MALNINLETSEQPTTIRFALVGQLDAASASTLESSIHDALGFDIKTLVLNLHGLDFISSAGLRVFAKVQKLMRQRTGRVLFVNVQPQIQKVFDIIKSVKVSDVFASYAELEAYLKVMQQSPRGPETEVSVK